MKKLEVPKYNYSTEKPSFIKQSADNPVTVFFLRTYVFWEKCVGGLLFFILILSLLLYYTTTSKKEKVYIVALSKSGYKLGEGELKERVFSHDKLIYKKAMKILKNKNAKKAVLPHWR